MRTATRETRQALRAAIAASGLSPYAWAKSVGVRHATVYDCLSATQPIREKRENTVRAALPGLTPLASEQVVINPHKQKIVNRQGPAPYVTRQLRLTPAEAAELDDFVTSTGYGSFSEMWHAERLLTWLFEQTLTGRSTPDR